MFFNNILSKKVIIFECMIDGTCYYGQKKGVAIAPCKFQNKTLFKTRLSVHRIVFGILLYLGYGGAIPKELLVSITL